MVNPSFYVQPKLIGLLVAEAPRQLVSEDLEELSRYLQTTSLPVSAHAQAHSVLVPGSCSAIFFDSKHHTPVFSEYPLSKMHPQNYQIYELKEVHIFSNIALYEIDCNTVTCPGFFVGGVPESYGALQAECSSFASVVSLPKPAMAGEWSLAKRGAGKKHGEKVVVSTQLFLGNQALPWGNDSQFDWPHIFQMGLVETTNHNYMHPLKPNGWNLKKRPLGKGDTSTKYQLLGSMLP